MPFLGYFVLNGQMYTAATLLFFSGLTDVLDGWLARKYNSYTVFGSIADPAADKGVMTVMVVCLAIKGLLPSESSDCRVLSVSITRTLTPSLGSQCRSPC